MQDLQRTLSLHVQYLQQLIYLDELTSATDVNRHFYDLPTTHVRRNPLVFPTASNPIKIVNLAEVSKTVQPGSKRSIIMESLFIEGGTHGCTILSTGSALTPVL